MLQVTKLAWGSGGLGSRLLRGTGQVQFFSRPQFLLQIMKGPGLSTECPSSLDLCVGSRLGTWKHRPLGELQARIFPLGA